jgi:hypothetical protein
MSKKGRIGTWTAIATLFAIFVLWISEPYGAMQALGECLRPTTLTMIPLPEGCEQTSEVPPANLMRIVEYQRAFYHLTLQRLVVCRSPRRYPQNEPTFSELAFSEKVRKQWRPLYVGCCSYQFRRHVTVVVAENNERGSVLVVAALIQSRWRFLRLNWHKYRSY